MPQGCRQLTQGYKVGYSLWHIFSKEPNDNPPCMQTLSDITRISRFRYKVRISRKQVRMSRTQVLQ